MSILHVFYRLSDKGEDKEKLPGINNKICLDNFLEEFPAEHITVVADNVRDETLKWLETYNFRRLINTNLGNSGSFWLAYNLALKLEEEDYVYFVENDYLHRPKSADLLMEGLEFADYVTLYDHPDKYAEGMNPCVHGGGEDSKVFLTKSSHWKKTNSTTMTFASKVSVLKKDRLIFKLFSVGLFKSGVSILKKIGERRFPADYRIFYFLTKFKSRLLISPLPGYSTHGEAKFVSPLVDWESYIHHST
jgi:glycosyltransferase involved in cell wall biosynthesis